MAQMMRPRGSRRPRKTQTAADEAATPEGVIDAADPDAPADTAAEPAAEVSGLDTAPVMVPEVEFALDPEPAQERATRQDDEEPAQTAPAAPTAPAVTAPEPELKRFVINLNMLSNVDVKFHTRGTDHRDVINRWRSAIGRAKREHPEDAVEVVMGGGDSLTSYILYLAEVTAFAVGSFVDDSDAIDCTVDV